MDKVRKRWAEQMESMSKNSYRYGQLRTWVPIPWIVVELVMSSEEDLGIVITMYCRGLHSVRQVVDFIEKLI
jgi:hypothetical protein